jgi:hypothetical protein
VKPEHEEHLGSPSAETFDSHEPLDDFFVRESVELFEPEAPVCDPRAKVAQVTNFLTAEADRTKRPVVKGRNRRGTWYATIVEQRYESAENGGGCLRR